MLQEKIEVIISKSRIIFDAIESNFGNSNFVKTFHISHNYWEEIGKLAKIDTLILDDALDSNVFLHHIKTIINLTSAKLTSNDIYLKKPLKLTELLEIIKNNRVKTQIFCRLNHEWIYDEQLCKLFNQATIIRFTEKENEVFKYLLTSKNHKISKEDLFRAVWQYHQDSNSTTIETHMSRLRQKLPQDFMHLKSNYYELMINDII